MSRTPYTQPQNFQFRGPQSSEVFNEMTEQQVADIVFLYNWLNQLNFDMTKFFSILGKNQVMIAKSLDDMDSRISVLEGGLNRIGFSSQSQIDTDRFNSVPTYTVASGDRLSYDSRYSFLTLPKIESSSMSKIKYENPDGTYSVSSFLEMNVVSDGTSADDSTATIDTSPPYYAVNGVTGKIWERNVVRSNINSSGAIMDLFIKIPQDLAVDLDINNLQFSPYPMFGADILSISYTTRTNPSLTSSETWTPLNQYANHSGDAEAVGFVPPGGWSDDEILNSGLKSFHFDPMPITAFRIRFRQRNYFKEGDQYIYSYGLSNLDIRLDKFTGTGKAIIRFDAPSGDTISNVYEVVPQAWNIPANQIDDLVTTRVIWETSYNSGMYTLTPVPFSRRVWVEVTLNETSNGGTPQLHNLVISYLDDDELDYFIDGGDAET